MGSVYRHSRLRASQALTLTAVFCLSLTIGGCMSVGPMTSLLADDDVTGAIPASAASPVPALSAQDWGFASKALAGALDPQGSGAAVLWENIASGVRGSMTPVGLVYEADGRTCRAFLAEIGGRAPVQRLQGRGCREGREDWLVSDLKLFGS